MSEERVTEWIQSRDGICELYANMVHVTWSLDDIRVRFGHLVPNPATPNPGPTMKAVAEELGAVTLTWRGAKLLRDNLTAIINSYEKTNGEIKTEIKLPPSPDEK